jgi:uncharacterized OsmC-like protein
VAEILIDHVVRDRFEIEVRGHRVTVDQPADAGGDDAGPTPTELFVASLASCAAFYAERFLRRHGGADGLRVLARYEMSQERPARVTLIEMDVRVPVALAPEVAAGLRRSIERCTVHNSLRVEPEVSVRLATGAAREVA